MNTAIDHLGLNDFAVAFIVVGMAVGMLMR